MANTEERSGNLVVQGYLEALGGMGTPLEVQMKTATGMSEAKNAIQAGTLAGIQALIADMASDARITPSEKKTLYAQWLGIEAEHPIIIDQAEAAGIGATNLYRSDYEDEYDNLYEYLYTVPGIFVDMDLTSDIVALDFQAVFANYYDARQTLIGVIQLKGKGVATWLITEGSITLVDAITVQKTGGVDGAWDAQAYSLEKFSICAAAFRAHQANLALMVGLNVDPATSISYTDLDYAFNLKADGTYSIYVAGAEAFDPAAAYTVNSIFELDYDGRTVYFVVDGVLIYAAYDPQKAFAVDTSFNGLNARIDNATFSPNAKLPRPAQYLDQIAATPGAASFAPTKIFGDWCFSTTDQVYYRWTGSAWTTSGITTRMKMEGLQDLLGASGAADAVAFMDVLVDRLSARIIRLLTTGALVGGDRYDDEGKLLDATAPGFFLPASGLALLASAIFSGSIYSCGPIYSNPGMIWETSTHPFGAGALTSIYYNDGTWIAVNNSGKIARSTDDCLTWSSLIANPFGGGDIYHIACGNGVWIAVGAGGAIARSTDDGLTWGSLISNPFGATTNISSIAYGNDVWIAVGYDDITGAGRIARSTDDGLTWGSLITHPFGAGSIHNIEFGNGIWTSVGGGIARSTDDGLTWGSLITNPLGVDHIYAITYSGSSWIVGGSSGKISRSTDDCLTWSSLISNPFASAPVPALIRDIKPTGNGMIYAVAAYGMMARSQDDGLSWEEPGSDASYTPFGSAPYWYELGYNQISGRLVVVGNNGSGTSYIVTSSWVEAGAGIKEAGHGDKGRAQYVLFSNGLLLNWGWTFRAGNGTSSATTTVTFPKGYPAGALPFHFESAVQGYKNGSDPTSQADTTSLATIRELRRIISNTQAMVGFYDPANHGSTTRVVLTYMAIGMG